METITNRIDNTTEIAPEYRAEIIPAPKSVKIELTSRCNFSCAFCAHEKGGRDMDYDFYLRVVDEMVEAGVKELGLFYIGESLMCSWLPDAISYAKKAGIEYTFLTTNGSLLTPLKCSELMEAGLDSLKFSFNNANANQFRQVTGTSARMYRNLIDNIKSACAVRDMGKHKTRLYASSIAYDGEQQKKMRKAVEEILPYVDEHYWLPLFSFGGQAKDSEEEIGMAPPTVGNPGRAGNMRPPLPCWAVFKEGHITAAGRLSACCFDTGSGWEMADLNKVSFMEGWNSEKFQELRRAHLAKDIRGTACMDCMAK
ncbi:radical SAM protein [Candidatus Pacearchaeota archaeon]|nr:radical SAM protein [Candidatus Pacearchaeota archaeon]